jgi:hypothetical protein
MSRLHRLWPVAMGLAAVSGCAPAARTTAAGPMRMPDCSFTAASTCWTLTGRFPPRRSVARDTTPDMLLSRPPVLAAADSIRRLPDTHDLTESH